MSAGAPFYDFYDVNNISLNELNWFDSSHFNFSIGDYIIESIQKGNYLITQANIDKHLLSTRKSIHNLITKVLPIKYIYTFHASIELADLNPIYKLINYIENKDISSSTLADKIILHNIESNDSITIDEIFVDTENVILDLKITSKNYSKSKISYKNTPK